MFAAGDLIAGKFQIVERFLREARSSAQLRSEHVCRVSDVGVLDTGAPYFVMELLEGRDLASLLAERGPVPVALVTDYVRRRASGSPRRAAPVDAGCRCGATSERSA